MAINFMIPMDQTIQTDAYGYGSVYVVHDNGAAQFYRCYPADFTDANKNKPFVCQWVAAGNAMPEIVPYPVPTLVGAKAAKIAAIDAKTAALITAGFVFGGENFSMSDAAQRNWIGLAAAKANGMLSFPIAVSTVSEGAFTIADATAFAGFLAAYLTYQVNPAAPLASGRALKALVNAAESVEAVNAIEDNR
jgi:hypothetical protein